MYEGKTKFNAARAIVVNRRTGQLGSLGITPTWSNTPAFTIPMPWERAQENLPVFTESDTNDRFVWRAPLKLPPAEFDLQEIVVSGTRIPWWMWGIGGVLAASVLFKGR